MIAKLHRYGRVVYEDVELDDHRRLSCLCKSCDRLIPGSENNCRQAEVLFALCRTVGMAVAVSRCAEFKAK